MSKLYLTPCALALALAANNVAAQSAPTLEEIVVTAQKRSEDLQSVPIAISAFTSKTRDLIGITTIQDLTNFTPGLSYSTSLDRSSLRGIGRQTNNLASDPGVATYNDGFYNVSTRAASRSPILVERIEILRGPQGTLYGRNSIGGTINVVSRQPTKDWYGEVRGSLDNWQRRVGEGAVSGPITDWLRFRLAASIARQDKGYFKNVSGYPDEGGVEDDHYFEGQVSADFGSNVEFWAKATMSGYDNSRRSAALVGPYDYGKVPSGYLAPAGAYGLVLTGSNYTQIGTQTTTNPALNDIRSFSNDVTTQNKQSDSPTFIAHLTWHLGGVDLKYLGGYSSYHYLLKTDFDGTAVDSYTIPLAAVNTCAAVAGCGPLRYRPSSIQYYIEDKRYWSHEINVSSNGDSRFQWIAGAYYYDENYTQPVYFPTENPALQTPTRTTHPGFVVTNGAIPNPSGWIYYIDTHLHTTSKAAFGQIDWSMTDAWKLTTGVRYTEDEKSGAEYTRQLCYGLSSFLGCPDLSTGGTSSVAADVTDYLTFHTPAPGTTGLAELDPATGNWVRGLDAKWSATTGTAGVEWTPNSDTHLYGKYSRGYKSGGFNSGAIVELPLTAPETVDAFEIGLKQQLAKQLQINASVFYYSYKGMQIPLSVIPTAGPTQTQFFNMDKVTSKGVEVETIWQPIDRLQILFNYAYLNATIDSGCCFVDGADPRALQPSAQPSGPLTGTSQGQSLAGQRVPQSPEQKAALNVNYTFKFSPGNLNLSGSDIWKDQTYFSVFNRPYNLAPSYNQVDLRATWTTASEHLTIIAFGRNVFDDKGYDGTTGLLQTQLPTGGVGVPTIPANIAQSISLTPPRTYGVEFQYRF